MLLFVSYLVCFVRGFIHSLSVCIVNETISQNIHIEMLKILKSADWTFNGMYINGLAKAIERDKVVLPRLLHILHRYFLDSISKLSNFL